MGHLLYFINPQVDITPLRLAMVTLVYGLICGVLFGTALWGFRLLRVRLLEHGQPDTNWRAHGFGFVVLAAFIAAAVYWIHVDVLRIYLPITAWHVLAKATNLITVTAFLLLVLWIAERNADRRRARIIFGAGIVLIAVSSFFLYQRRESYRVEKRNVVVADIGSIAGKRPVILVAVRNLPYDWIVTMSGEGVLPFFERAARESYFTRLEPFPTPSSRALWASLATGKLPYRHGITGRFSYRTPLNGRDPSERFLLLPSGVGFRTWGLIPPVERISSTLPSGDALPIWSLFSRLGLHARVITWPVSGPRAQQPSSPLPPGVAQRFSSAKVRAHLAADIDALHSGMQSGEDDLTVVTVEGFAETQRELDVWSNELPSSGRRGETLRAYAQQIDRLIGELQQANREHIIVVCSPTAVSSPALPDTPWSFVLQGLRSRDPGADDGFLLIAGPGAMQRPNPSPAFVADVVPTLLFAAGLPVGRDMDGRIISEAFADEFLLRTTLSAIQTYEAEQLVVRRRGA